VSSRDFHGLGLLVTPIATVVGVTALAAWAQVV
jgi:hypothetical protein